MFVYCPMSPKPTPNDDTSFNWQLTNPIKYRINKNGTLQTSNFTVEKKGYPTIMVF